jgi:hypothetical protein
MQRALHTAAKCFNHCTTACPTEEMENIKFLGLQTDNHLPWMNFIEQMIH